MSAARARGGQRGFSLVGAMAGIAIMLIMMGAAVPSWQYVMKDAREEELLFRGGQIADAIFRYQQKHGGAPPNSLEDLVKGKFLRKAWNDPLAKDGKWRLLAPGEVGPGARPKSRRGPGSELGLGVADRPGAVGGRLGGFVGVATRVTGDSLRILNGQTKYEDWRFVAVQPRVLGRQRTIGGVSPAGAAGAPEKGPRPPGPAPGASPGAVPPER
ncbi:MAG TPA: type II secretion system protein [Vicinamibacteria bacterium]|nr:type II secretion system protein [Vicinamibacteria bacterium]